MSIQQMNKILKKKIQKISERIHKNLFIIIYFYIYFILKEKLFNNNCL